MFRHGLYRWGTDYSSPCKVSTQSIQLMYSMYLILYTHVQTVLDSAIHFQSAPHLYSPCPVSQSPSVVSRCPAFIHFYRPFSESTASLQLVSSQNTISAAPWDSTPSSTHVLSVHHLSCPCPVSILTLLSISSKYYIYAVHVQFIPLSPYADSTWLFSVQSVIYLYNPCVDSTPSLQPMSCLYPISTAQIKTVCNI